MAKNFNELRDKMSPERQAKVAERTKEMLADMKENHFCRACMHGAHKPGRCGHSLGMEPCDGGARCVVCNYLSEYLMAPCTKCGAPAILAEGE